jgi:AcrR family transcriptional regulator
VGVDPGAGGGRERQWGGWAPTVGESAGPRERLLAAGRRLLLEHGDSSYSVAELIRAAGVALKTFYRSFPSKDEFLQAVFISLVGGSAGSFEERVRSATTDPLDRLRLAIWWAIVARDGDEDEAGSRILVGEHMRISRTSPETIRAISEPYTDLIRVLAVDATAAGLIAPADLDDEVHIITTMVIATYHARVLGLTTVDQHRLADRVWRFCLTALRGTEEAHARAATPLPGGGAARVGPPAVR